MNIVGSMVVGKGEADRYLDKALSSLDRLCDQALIVLNKADEKTAQMVKNSGFAYYKDSRTWGYAQNKIKQKLFLQLQQLNPDWIVTLDADEEFSESFTREELEKLIETESVSWRFFFVQLWNGDDRCNKDLSFWNVRLWKYKKGKLEIENKPLHCGLAPKYHYKFSNHAPFVVYHHGLKEKEERERRVERYNKYDPDRKYKAAWYYNQLKSDKKGDKFERDLIEEKVAETVESWESKIVKPKNMADEEQKYHYIKRHKDGKVIDVPAEHVENNKIKVEHTVITDEPVTKGESPEGDLKQEDLEDIAEGEKKGVTCEVCGYVPPSKTKRGLSMHMRKHD